MKAWSSEQEGSRVRIHAEDEAEDGGDREAGEREWPDDAPEGVRGSRTEARGRVLERGIDALEDGLEHQDHIGQVEGDDADHHGGRREHHVEGRGSAEL